jgi:hypothetical protein
MDKELIKPMLAGIARQGIAALGAYMGFTGTQETQFIGAGMVLASLGWEWWQARGERQVIAILAKMKPVAPESATTAQAAKAGADAAKAELAK